MSQPKVAIAITVDDKTAKGFASAEKRGARTVGQMSADNKRWARDAQASVLRSGRGMVGTLARVEQASARVFGGRSITSGLTSRMSALGQAAGDARVGMAAAAEAGGGLATAVGAVGVAAAATVGIVAAAAVGAIKFASSWADGAASIGRTAETIGVATKALQEFEAAGQRAGMNKGAATGTLGSLSQVLNDARYGRNSGALAVLGRMGVKMQLNKDGTVDVAAMLPAIADAIARQNSSGRRTAAGALGIGADAIPLFAGGGKAMAADMADADRHAAVIDDAGINTGRRIARKGVMVGQLKDRALADAGGATAGAIEGGYDAVLSGGRALTDGTASFGGIVSRTFAPAAEKVERGGRAIERAAGAMFTAAGGVGRLSPMQIRQKAAQGNRLIGKLMGLGLSQDDAIAMAANAAMESSGNAQAKEKGGRGYGLFQITDRSRRAAFRQVMGVDVENSTEDQQLRYQVWETRNREARTWRLAHANGGDAASVAAGYARFVERPANKDRDSAERAAVADAMHVTVELKNAPPGTRATVRRGSSTGPAISHAMVH